MIHPLAKFCPRSIAQILGTIMHRNDCPNFERHIAGESCTKSVQPFPPGISANKFQAPRSRRTQRRGPGPKRGATRAATFTRRKGRQFRGESHPAERGRLRSRLFSELLSRCDHALAGLGVLGAPGGPILRAVGERWPRQRDGKQQSGRPDRRPLPPRRFSASSPCADLFHPRDPAASQGRIPRSSPDRECRPREKERPGRGGPGPSPAGWRITCWSTLRQRRWPSAWR